VNPIVKAFFLDFLFDITKSGAGSAIRGTTGALSPANPASLPTSSSKYLVPFGDAITAYRAAPAMAAQSALLNKAFGIETPEYNPGAILEDITERNRALMRDTRAGEIAKAQLAVEQATNPEIAKAMGLSSQAAYDLLGKTVEQMLSRPDLAGSSAIVEAGRAV
jgi:hypothetical protein